MAEAEFIQSTKASYDKVAAHYTARFLAELAARPLDRALLGGFAELVRTAGGAPIADIGCGPGSVTAYLNDLGSSAFGIDLSPQMVAQARQAYPELRFEEGSMLALDLPDSCLGGIVAWYSIIHVPDEQLPRAIGQFHRVLIPGGYVLVAFQAGNEVWHRANMAGHAISLDFHLRQPEQVADLLSRSGLEVRARVLREPDDVAEFPEDTPQAFLLARRPVSAAALPAMNPVVYALVMPGARHGAPPKRLGAPPDAPTAPDSTRNSRGSRQSFNHHSIQPPSHPDGQRRCERR